MTVTATPPGRVVVVGGGFAGAAFAIHLLRDHPDLAADVTVIEPRPRLGAGLAYGTDEPAWRVNVAAARMSVFAECPDDFDRWLRDRDALRDDPDGRIADGRLYPRRAWFGRYVDETLRALATGGTVAGTCRHHRAVAVDASPRPDGGYAVRLDDGATVEGDVLLVATGHPPPSTPAFLRDLPPDRLIADPWAAGAIAAVRPADDVLVVGTGLTACDVIAALDRRGHRGRVVAVSRRGLLPRPRTTRPVSAFGAFTDPPATTARALLRRVRDAVGAAATLGRPWEDVIDALRTEGGTVWRALPLPEQRRLLRHLRPFWDVHRFQSAPPVDAALARLRDAGRLLVRAATVERVVVEGDGVVATLRPRGASDATPERHRVATVIDCTGPGHRSLIDIVPFLGALAATGRLVADPTRLGIATDTDSRALDATGRPAQDLFVLGPLARAAHGELMGLPQVSAQPRAVARVVASAVASAHARRAGEAADGGCA